MAILVLFDPRIAYVTLIAVLIYTILNIKSLRKSILSALYTFAIPFGISFLLHAFWILPLLIFRMSPLPQNFDSVQGFEFFSFADFSHSMSFLHPNWPENVFGKTYFLRPEFLLLPVLAFFSLLFLNKSKVKSQNLKLSFDPELKTEGQLKIQKYNNDLTIEQFNNKIILFFVTLGLIGAFLAKGASEPFGTVNIWMFENIPGFTMFRDPTKFYILIALSYSILIPFSVYSIHVWLNSKFRTHNFLPNLFLIFTFSYLVFLVHPVFFGQIFKTREVPKEYVHLKDFLYNQPEFFRTLWIPQWQRFGYFSNNHPAIGREEIFKGDAEKQMQELRKPSSEKILSDFSVKYVIVPYDSEGEIFLKDRKYDNKQYLKTIEELKQIKWLKQVNCSIASLAARQVKSLNCYLNNPFEKIAVFEVYNQKDHFWSSSENIKVQYYFIKSTEYNVEVKNALKGDVLTFAESFDKNWIAESLGFRIPSLQFQNTLNSFILPKDGNYILKVYYEPQEWVNMGLGISGITFFVTLAVLLFGKTRSK